MFFSTFCFWSWLPRPTLDPGVFGDQNLPEKHVNHDKTKSATKRQKAHTYMLSKIGGTNTKAKFYHKKRKNTTNAKIVYVQPKILTLAR